MKDVDYYDVYGGKDYNYISSRIIDNKGKLRGYLVATKEEGSKYFNVGFSMKNPKDKKFNKDWGMSLALTRAVLVDYRNIKIPKSIKNEVNDMVVRARKYFKDTEYSNNCI